MFELELSEVSYARDMQLSKISISRASFINIGKITHHTQNAFNFFSKNTHTVISKLVDDSPVQVKPMPLSTINDPFIALEIVAIAYSNILLIYQLSPTPKIAFKRLLSRDALDQPKTVFEWQPAYTYERSSSTRHLAIASGSKIHTIQLDIIDGSLSIETTNSKLIASKGTILEIGWMSSNTILLLFDGLEWMLTHATSFETLFTGMFDISLAKNTAIYDGPFVKDLRVVVRTGDECFVAELPTYTAYLNQQLSMGFAAMTSTVFDWFDVNDSYAFDLPSESIERKDALQEYVETRAIAYIFSHYSTISDEHMRMIFSLFIRVNLHDLLTTTFLQSIIDTHNTDQIAYFYQSLLENIVRGSIDPSPSIIQQLLTHLAQINDYRSYEICIMAAPLNTLDIEAVIRIIELEKLVSGALYVYSHYFMDHATALRIAIDFCEARKNHADILCLFMFLKGIVCGTEYSTGTLAKSTHNHAVRVVIDAACDDTLTARLIALDLILMMDWVVVMLQSNFGKEKRALIEKLHTFMDDCDDGYIASRIALVFTQNSTAIYSKLLVKSIDILLDSLPEQSIERALTSFIIEGHELNSHQILKLPALGYESPLQLIHLHRKDYTSFIRSHIITRSVFDAAMKFMDDASYEESFMFKQAMIQLAGELSSLSADNLFAFIDKWFISEHDNALSGVCLVGTRESAYRYAKLMGRVDVESMIEFEPFNVAEYLDGRDADASILCVCIEAGIFDAVAACFLTEKRDDELIQYLNKVLGQLIRDFVVDELSATSRYALVYFKDAVEYGFDILRLFILYTHKVTRNLCTIHQQALANSCVRSVLSLEPLSSLSASAFIDLIECCLGATLILTETLNYIIDHSFTNISTRSILTKRMQRRLRCQLNLARVYQKICKAEETAMEADLIKSIQAGVLCIQSEDPEAPLSAGPALAERISLCMDYIE